MTFTVEIRPAARRAIAKLERAMQGRVIAALEALADEPRPHGCIKLTGKVDLFRIRVGDYRVIYTVRDQELLVLVVHVGHRREVYK